MDTKRMRERILKLYDKEVLVPELGHGRLAQTLREGLSRVLAREVQENLSLPIDYGALRRIEEAAGRGGSTERLMGAFKMHGIETYGDLVAYAGHFLPQGRGAGARGLVFQNVGPVSERVLYTHLNDLGILLCGDAYSNAELIPLQKPV